MESTETTVTTTVDRSVAEFLITTVAIRDEQGRWVIDGVAYWVLEEALGVALRKIADEG